MFMSVIKVCNRVAGISPEARLLLYFLSRQRAGAGLTVDTLRGLLGVSERVMSRLRRELLAHGYVVERELDATGEKRERAFLLSPGFAEMGPVKGGLSPRIEDGGEWAHLSGRVLALKFPLPLSPSKVGAPKKPPSRQGSGRLLSASNRLLLAVLFGLADECGVVRRVWPKTIAQLVGMTGGQLRYQLEKLLDLGLIRAIVPGVTGQALFGVSPGAYFLNLSHRAFGESPSSSWWLIYPASPILGEGGSLKRDIAALYRQLRLGKGLAPDDYWGEILAEAGMIEPQQIMQLKKYFDGVGSPNLPSYMQMKVEEYASWLLSHHRSHLLQIHRGEVPPIIIWEKLGLTDNVAEDLFPPAMGGVVKDDERMVVVRLVASLSGLLALRIDGVLRSSFMNDTAVASGTPLGVHDDYRCLVMPETNRAARHVCAIQVIQSGPVGNVGMIFQMSAKNPRAWLPAPDPFRETDLSDANAFSLGMMTPPISSGRGHPSAEMTS